MNICPKQRMIRRLSPHFGLAQSERNRAPGRARLGHSACRGPLDRLSLFHAETFGSISAILAWVGPPHFFLLPLSDLFNLVDLA